MPTAHTTRLPRTTRFLTAAATTAALAASAPFANAVSKTWADSDPPHEISGSETYDGQSAIDGTNPIVNIVSPGALSILTDFTIGKSANGTLNIAAGAQLSTGNLTYLGYSSGAKGTVTVNGDQATWNSTGLLAVGYDGSGSLTIANGGKVIAANLVSIGRQTGSVGEVFVRGKNSALTASTSTITVGNQGTAKGTLEITDGGTVFGAAGIYISNDANTIGEVLVSGPGSSMTNNGALDIGRIGNGSLTISDGATVRAGSVSFGAWTSSRR